MAIAPGVFNDTLQRRADYGIQLQFLDSSETAINLTGWTVQMQVWNKLRTTKYADATVSYTDRVNGTVDILLTDTDTATFPAEVYYDVLLINPSGLREYYLEGIFYMSESYTA